jgi:predicted neuraminidase
MTTIGTRAEVFYGFANKTASGLKKNDFFLGNDGSVKSKAARKAALDRMKAEGNKHFTKIFPTKKGCFCLSPAKCSKAYQIRMKKMNAKNKNKK